jgi:hypothetical protein
LNGYCEVYMAVRDVILTRRADEGYGFVIISSLIKPGSVVGKKLLMLSLMLVNQLL